MSRSKAPGWNREPSEEPGEDWLPTLQGLVSASGWWAVRAYFTQEGPDAEWVPTMSCVPVIAWAWSDEWTEGGVNVMPVLLEDGRAMIVWETAVWPELDYPGDIIGYVPPGVGFEPAKWGQKLREWAEAQGRAEEEEKMLARKLEISRSRAKSRGSELKTGGNDTEIGGKS